MNISVIIPVYNVEAYIEKCMLSIANQTFQDKVECIIVNDCTPDNSMEIVQSIISQYSGQIQFKVINHSQNAGLATARNTGMSAASGQYVIHIDSDDYCEHDMLEKMYATAIMENADMVVADYYIEYPKKRIYRHQSIPRNKEEILNNLIEDNKPSYTIGRELWTKLIKRSLYESNNIHSEKGINYNEDLIVTLPLAFYANKIAKIDAAFVHYRKDNPNAYTMKFNIKNLENRLQANQKIECFLNENGLDRCINSLNVKKMNDKLYALLYTTGDLQSKYTSLYSEVDIYWLRSSSMPKYKKIVLYFALTGHMKVFNSFKRLNAFKHRYFSDMK